MFYKKYGLSKKIYKLPFSNLKIQIKNTLGQDIKMGIKLIFNILKAFFKQIMGCDKIKLFEFSINIYNFTFHKWWQEKNLRIQPSS